MIPEMTHKLGQYWEQPAREDIATDKTHAVMSPEDFCQLSDYSASIPSGVYPGKMWKRKNRAEWLLCWYSETENDPETNDINYRIILLT